MIKTLRRNEMKLLLNMMDDMIEHFKMNKSLLVRIYGMFTIKTKVFGSIDLVLMENTFKNRNL